MAERIELPKTPAGSEQEQLREVYAYLYRMAVALNSNMAEIGGTQFTDEEMQIVREVTGAAEGTEADMSGAETLKSLIIKTAKFVKSEIDQYNLRLTGSYEAEGKLGRYVRKTRLDVDVTPSGIQQNYTFEAVIQGLQTFEINSKNYIRTGLLRTVDNVPVYGVQIGKDIVTFSDDGTQTVDETKKVAELTADELSFWQSGEKIASYKGNRISFYYGGDEVMYIASGRMYFAGDVEITSGNTMKIKSGGGLDIESGSIFRVASASLDINERGLDVKRGVLQGTHYDEYGIELVSRKDIVISRATPSGAHGMIWLFPQDTRMRSYSFGIIDEQDLSSSYSHIMNINANTGLTGTNTYRITVPVWCGATDAGTMGIWVGVTNDNNKSVQFTGTIPEAYIDEYGILVDRWNLVMTASSSDWLGDSANLLSFNILAGTGATEAEKLTHGLQAGTVKFEMISGTPGWRDCDVKVFI